LHCNKKTHNVARFATIVSRLDVFVWRWFHLPWHDTIAISTPRGSFFFFLDISCKYIIAYSTVNSFIGIVSKAVFKCSYEGSKFSSKVMITSSFLISKSKQGKLIYKHLYLVDMIQQVITFFSFLFGTNWRHRILLICMCRICNKWRDLLASFPPRRCCKKPFMSMFVLCSGSSLR
jgi:hypothetical protein